MMAEQVPTLGSVYVPQVVNGFWFLDGPEPGSIGAWARRRGTDAAHIARKISPDASSRPEW